MMIVKGIYSVGTFLLSFLVLPFFLLRERGRRAIWQRYGIWNLPRELQGRKVAWFHGASVGEVSGLLPIMQEYRKRYPEHVILLTASSVTGLDRAEKVAHYKRLVPFDSTIWIKLALSGLRPHLFVFGETEIWPCLIDELSRRGTPMVLVNGRISDQSFRFYQMLRWCVGPSLKRIGFVLAGDAVSAERFEQLGVDRSKIRISGNTKYDRAPSVSDEDSRRALIEACFGAEAPTVVLGSLWPGEEEVLFPALKGLLAESHALHVIVAPRHGERFEYFAEKLSQYGLPFTRRSVQERNGSSSVQQSSALRVLLLDSIGELESFYSLADIAFIGGSLVDIGGHNPLEAAAYSACIAMGPHVQNIREVHEQLRERSAVTEIRTTDDFLRLVRSLLDDSQALSRSGAEARRVWLGNMGASGRVFEELGKIVAAG